MTAVALAVALVLVASACGSGGWDTVASGSSQVTTPVADLGSRLRPSITAVMRDLAIPGAVVLVRPTQQYREAFGTRVVGTDNPVQVRDHFRIGSNPKTMTGTVVLQLVQEGRMALSDPISNPAQRPRSAAPKPWRRGRCRCPQVSVRRTALVNGTVAVVVASRGQLLLALTFTIEDEGSPSTT